MCCFPGFGYLPLGSLEVPISPLPCAVRARRAALALLGSALCCCLGLSCSFPSVSLLKGKQTTNPASESAFWSLHPFGGKKPLYLLQLEQSAALRLGRGQAQWSWRCWRSLEFAGLCRHTQRSLVPLSVTLFLRRGSRFQLKPEVSRARGNQGTACNGTETQKPA